MAIPQRVKDAAREAEEQLRALTNPPAGENGENGEPANDPAANPNEVPPAPPSAGGEGGGEANPPPANGPTATPTTPEAEMQQLLQQLRTEAGRNAALQAELAELKGRLSEVSEQVRSNRAPAPAPPPAPKRSLITDEDRKEFGDDMVDFAGRVAREVLGPMIEQMGRRLNVLEQNVGKIGKTAEAASTTAAEQRFNRYIADLDQQVPGWRETNDDPAFVDWLAQRDTFSRKKRHDLLSSAHAEADSQTVAEFFRAYWKEKGNAPATPAAAPPSNAPPAPKVDPATLVAPKTTHSPPPTANQSRGKQWTQAEIEKVYDDRMKKRISAEEFAKLEADINAAILEGRVTL